MKHFIIILLILCVLGVLFCSRTGVESSKPLVAVSIPPQKFFVEKIAGDLVDVFVMIPPGASPHVYEPKPVQMAEFDRAKAYFTIGTEFEKAWISRLTKMTPRIIVIPTDAKINKIHMDADSTATGHADHDHESLDPHIWLSPELVKIQASSITDGLCRLFPEHQATFRKNDSVFAIELSRLQDSIRGILTGLKQERTFMVFHPSWGYFAREFNLKQISIEVQGTEPNPTELKSILLRAKKARIHTIFVQPQFSQRTAATISRELHARVAIADPLAESWDANLVACAQALAHGIQ